MLGITNVRLETISNVTIKYASVLLENGKILALGKHIYLSNCKRIKDGKRRVVTPEITVGQGLSSRMKVETANLIDENPAILFKNGVKV